MAQLSKISKNNTKVYRDFDGRIVEVWLHNTCILQIDWNKHIMSVCTGGWPTVATQTRLNQAFNEIGLPFYARRAGGVITILRDHTNLHYAIDDNQRLGLGF